MFHWAFQLASARKKMKRTSSVVVTARPVQRLLLKGPRAWDPHKEQAVMAIENLTETTFPATLDAADGILLIDWWAPWCAPCRAFGPTYEKVSKAHPDITFGKVNTEAEPGLGASFGIRSIPTLMIFREGVLLFQQAGMLPEAALEDLIKQVRALDMDDVRAKIAEEEAKHDHSSCDHDHGHGHGHGHSHAH